MGEAFGLYTHIRNNRIRSNLLMVGLFVLVGLVGFAITLLIEAQAGGASLTAIINRTLPHMVIVLPLGIGISLIWAGIGLAANTSLLSWATGSQAITREDNPRLYALLENLCISRGMAVPRLAAIESPALNAFASGINAQQYTITVTTGLMEALNDAELEAVLAHELTHIRNEDVKLMVIAVLVAGVISFFGELALRNMRFSGGGDDRKGKGGGAAMLLAFAVLAVAWLFSTMIRFSLSRSREYLADAGAVELTKNPDAMISALLKIAGRADIEGVPSGIMDMCIENDPDDLGDLFSTHPSIPKRVQALQAYAGGRLEVDAKPRLGPPRVGERTSFPEMVEKRGPWGSRGE
jgi:heat shock protein HtpX